MAGVGTERPLEQVSAPQLGSVSGVRWSGSRSRSGPEVTTDGGYCSESTIATCYVELVGEVRLAWAVTLSGEGQWGLPAGRSCSAGSEGPARSPGRPRPAASKRTFREARDDAMWIPFERERVGAANRADGRLHRAPQSSRKGGPDRPATRSLYKASLRGVARVGQVSRTRGGPGGGGRTRTTSRPPDFESGVSDPPPRVGSSLLRVPSRIAASRPQIDARLAQPQNRRPEGSPTGWTWLDDGHRYTVQRRDLILLERAREGDLGAFANSSRSPEPALRAGRADGA